MNTYGISRKKSNIKITVKDLHLTRQAIPLILAFAFLICALMLPDVIRSSVISSLNMCATRLIPSLFPFMVAGEIFFVFGGQRIFSRVIGKPFEKLLGISESGASAFVLGAVCGLPLGGKYAISLYENGAINKNECQRLMGICNNAGVAFVVMGIGYSLWKSTAFGWLLYITQIFSALIAGALLSKCEKKTPKNISIAPATLKKENRSFFAVFSDAVISSSSSMLRLCAFVVFFGAVCELIKYGALALELPTLFSATVSSFIEITFATAFARDFYLTGSLAAVHSARIITFFAVGFSGMSAHMQLGVFASEKKLSMRKYYTTKLLCGLICALTGAIVLHYFAF